MNDQGGIPVVPEQWQSINKVHTAAYAGRVGNRINYVTDTDNANSGSPVTQIIGSPFGLEQAIGIHTDGFCPGTFNSGTAIDHAGLQAFLAAPQGVAVPYNSAISKGLSTTFVSDNGGSDGGSIFFDVTTGPNAMTVSYQYSFTYAAVALPPDNYWVSVLGNEPGVTWAWARTNTLASAHAVRNGAAAWSLSSGDFAMRLCGTVQPFACYANCDNSTINPILNTFAAGEPYTNCDQSTIAPVLKLQDFSCFLNAFASGSTWAAQSHRLISRKPGAAAPATQDCVDRLIRIIRLQFRIGVTALLPTLV